MELQSKISLKSIGAQPKAGSLAEGEVRKLAIFYGRCVGYVTGESSFGEFIKFRGNFEAVNTETGEAFRSANILMPQIITDLLRDALDAREDDSAALEFAIELGAKYLAPREGDRNARGYEYTAVPITKLVESDELGHLRDAVKSKIEPASTEAKTKKGK